MGSVNDIPSHEGRSWEQSFRLPWRADNQYPEVEETFANVRKVFEEELTRAYESQPMDVEQRLNASLKLKKHLAPGVLAERFLKVQAAS
ncbi:MAG: hypothetical protein IJT59_07255 [Desulfovibrionaceae bacterium]|nr:hypothetical protein [Desulfovibrionaceae bacterium]